MLLCPRSLVPATHPGQKRTPLEAPGSSATICGQRLSCTVLLHVSGSAQSGPDGVDYNRRATSLPVNCESCAWLGNLKRMVFNNLWEMPETGWMLQRGDEPLKPQFAEVLGDQRGNIWLKRVVIDKNVL